MLHVSIFSGNVVMDGVVHLLVSNLFNPAVSWGGGFAQLISSCWEESHGQRDNAGMVLSHAHTCMSLTPLRSYLYLLSLSLSAPKLGHYSAVYSICLF